MKVTSPSPWLTTAEAAEYLRYRSAQGVRDAVARGHLKAHQRGRTYLFHRDDLDAFLTSPKGFMPGTKMAFKGISKETDRANLIAYLRQQHDSPPALPGN